MKNKWIECSKKLPEENEKVIFYPVDDEPIHGVYLQGHWFQCVSWCSIDSDEVLDNMVTIDVTHWIPAPEKP
jgi:hypothetical protein